MARRVGFLGSAAASLATGLVAVQVLRSGTPVSGVLFAHQASGFSLGVFDRRIVGVVSSGSLPSSPFRSRSSVLDTSEAPHWSRRSVFLGVTFNVLLGAVELVFVAGDLVTFFAPGS